MRNHEQSCSRWQRSHAVNRPDLVAFDLISNFNF